MAFVPGYKHDLFLSYAHDEAAWADAFRKALCDEFHVRTGSPLSVWQDTRNIRMGHKWTAEIEDGIRGAAAFLAVVSPIYLNSPWCRQERGIVLEKTIEALKVDAFYRFLKVVKTPDSDNLYEKLLEHIQDIRFFNPADGYELPEGSPEFTATIRAVVRHIRELLTLLGNQGHELYLAPGAIETINERKDVEHELKDRGFTVRPKVPLDPTFGEGPIVEAMEKASHALFILGGVYEGFTNQQIDVARQLAKPIVFWIQPGASHKDMLARIQGLADLPSGSEVLGGRSVREMIPQFLEKLKPKEPIQSATPASGSARVYVNYDTTLPEDSRIAARIADMVRQRNLEVVQSGRDGDHDQLMRTSNGVLLFRAAHPDPDQWLKFNAMELALASQIYQKNPDFAAKALLVSDPARIKSQAPGIPVYPWREPFAPETLAPFFDKLKGVRPASAGQ